MAIGNTDLGITLGARVDTSQAQKDINAFIRNDSENKTRKLVLNADINLNKINEKLEKAINTKGWTKQIEDGMQKISTSIRSGLSRTLEDDTVVRDLTKVTETFKNEFGKIQERVTVFKDSAMKPIASSLQTVKEGVKDVSTTTSTVVKEIDNVTTKVTTLEKVILDTNNEEHKIITTTKEWVDEQNKLHQEIKVTDENEKQLSATQKVVINDTKKAAKAIKEMSEALTGINTPTDHRTSKITYVDKNGVKTVKEMVDGIDTLITKTREYTTTQGALVKETKVLNTITGETKVHTEVIKNKEQEIQKSKELTEQLRKERLERVEAQKQIDNALVSTTSTKTTGKTTQFGDNSGRQYDATITEIRKVDEANRTVIQTTYEFINAQNQLVRQTRVTDENNRKLAADTIEISKSNEEATNSSKKYSNALNNINTSTKQTIQQTKTFSQSLSDAISRLAKYYVASLPIQAFRKAITETIQTVKDFDDALVEFRKVSDLAGDSLTEYIAKLAKMGEVTGSTMQAMVEAATEFKRSSFNDSDSAKLASIAEMYRNIADEEITAAESASFLISQMKAFNINANEAEHIIDAVNETSNKFAVSSADIATNLSKMSAVMAVNNVSFEQQIGMLVGVTEITRNASSATRGLTMIASRLTQVLDDSSSTGKKLTDIYEKLDISLKDENGQLRSTYDILKDLSEKWNTLSENEQKYISLTSAGARQQNVFTSLMKNFNSVMKATKTAYDSTGSAARENAKVMDTISKKMEVLRSEFQQIVIGKGGLTELSKGFLDVAIAALKFIDAIGGLTPLLVTLAGIIITIKADTIVNGFIKFNNIIINLIPNLQSMIAAFIQTTIETGSLSAGIKALGISASTAQIALGALTAVVSLTVIAFKKYQQQQEENHRIAKEVLKDYESYSDSLTETLKKIENENVSKSELIEINKKLNNSYDDEKAQLEDIKSLREENIKLLYKEAQEKAKATTRETLSETEKAKSYLDSKVKSTDLGGYNIERNTLLDTAAYTKTMTSTIGKSRAEQLDIVGKAIDKYNEKISNNIELSKSESLTLQQLTITYNTLKEKYDDATNTVNTYNQAEEVLKQTEEQFINTLRAKANEQGISTELTIEEQNKLIEQYHLTEEAIQEVLDAEEGMTRSEAIQYLVEQADAAGDLANASEDLAKTLDNLAQSLGITATELKGLRNRFDDLTLSKFLSQLAELKQTISDTSAVIDNLQEALSTAQTALDEYNNSGYLTLDTFQSLMGVSAQYLAALVNENGQLEINQTTLGNLVEQIKIAKIEELAHAAALEIAALNNQEAANTASAASVSVSAAGNSFAEAGSKAAKAAEGVAIFNAELSKATGGTLGDFSGSEKAIIDKYRNLAREISTLTVNTTKAGNAAKSAGRAGAGAAKQAKDATKDLNSELEKTKSNYDKVISWIGKQYDKEIDSIRKAKDEAVKAVEEEIRAKEKEKDEALGYIEEEIKALEKQKDAREKYWDKQIDALKKANKEKKDALELQEKLDALEKAKNTKVKIYKEGQGFVYDVDRTEVAKAQKELDEYLSEKAYEEKLARLEALKDAEMENFDKRIDAYNNFKDKVEKAYEEEISALEEHKNNLEEQYDAEIEMYENYKQQFEDMVNAYEEQQMKLLFTQLTGIDAENKNWMTRLDNLQHFVDEYNRLQAQLDTGNYAGGGGADTGGGGGGADTGGTTTTRTVTNQDTPDNQYSPVQNSKSTLSNSTGKTGYVPTSVTNALGTNSSGRVKSHASGVGSVKSDEIAIVGENPNKEIVIGSKINNGELMSLGKGTGVVNADSSKTLASMLNEVGQFGSSGFGSGNGTLNNNINNDSLVVNGVTIQGSNIKDPETFVNGLLNLKAEALQRAYRHR